MSRCYPYPPPGYEKKTKDTPVEIAPPAKVIQKEKHKHKDKDHKDKDQKEKKKKRKKDVDTNGDAHDKDKRSSKLQRTALVNDLHTENGRVRPEAKIVTVVERPALDSRRKDADSKLPSNDERPLDNSTKCQPSGGAKLYISNKELPNGKVDSNLPLPIVLSKPGASRHPADEEVAVPPRISVTHHIDGSSKKKQTNVGSEKQLPREDWVDKALREISVGLPQQDTSSAAMDDSQEWLFRRGSLHLKPKAKVEDSGAAEQEESPRVWAEAVYLPAVGMYALPYVVPF